MIKLNVGGGKGHPQIEGWTIIDIRDSADIKIDITKEKLPFKDNEVDIIFCSHTLEHIYRHDLKKVLDEFYRVLKPKTGVCRIVVPDIRKACFAYILNRHKFFKKATLTYYDNKFPIGGLLADWFYSYREGSLGNGHVHCFDFNYLKYWLFLSGFSSVKRSKYRKSSLNEIRIEGLDQHRHESLYVEAFK